MGIDGPHRKLWHRWHNEDIVMCAIMRGTGYDAIGGTITDYVDGLSIAFTLLLSSFSLWHTQKIGTAEEPNDPNLRRYVLIKRPSMGCMRGTPSIWGYADLGVNVSSNRGTILILLGLTFP